jgi:metal-responsive CopG/Arc/MetJ family transcriptional regulator
LAPANLSKTFDGMLKDWFRGRKGYVRVLIREYVLEEDGTGREPDRNEPLASFYAGA